MAPRTVATLRDHARDMFMSALKAVDPKEAVQRFMRLDGNRLTIHHSQVSLADVDRICVVGCGKAAIPMASAVEAILGERITDGTINIKSGSPGSLKRIRTVPASHPIPDEVGVQGARDIVRMVSECGERDLVICLISGGGSALMPLPVEGVTLAEKQEMTRLLLECGATINEINAIRKHISQSKGGRLAQAAAPAQMFTLILSDVIGDPLDTIASGPTAPDESTFQDCVDIFTKYGIESRVPASIRQQIARGIRREIGETPKPGDSLFNRVHNVVIGSNALAVEAARQRAAELGYNTLIFSTFVQGEAREVGIVYAAILKEIRKSGRPLGAPACVIAGGETTVTIRGSGLGGRNQEMALSTAMHISGLANVVFLSGGTDGADGPTDAAGAVVDGSTMARAEKEGMKAAEYLRNNDSYHFFKTLGDLLITGPTNTNVMDVQILLAG